MRTIHPWEKLRTKVAVVQSWLGETCSVFALGIASEHILQFQGQNSTHTQLCRPLKATAGSEGFGEPAPVPQTDKCLAAEVEVAVDGGDNASRGDA